jgi:glutamine amidotransferase
VLIDPPHGLYRQAWAPRRQRHGTVNADGFGVGWYADGDPVPARYRRAGPIWADPSFADLARVTTSRAVLAAVRDATDGTEPGEAAAAPFAADCWLFSHNGALSGWPEAGARLAADLPAGDVLALEARCDSAVIWAVVLRRLRAGSGLAEALDETIGELTARPARRPVQLPAHRRPDDRGDGRRGHPVLPQQPDRGDSRLRAWRRRARLDRRS